MTEIFISYAGDDREQARRLAEVLVSRGWRVWWDRKIPLGASFDAVIEQQLGQARCVLVLWSSASITSDWVKNEAREARDRGVLVPVLIESVRPPLEFRHVQTAQLVHWTGDPDDAGLGNLMRGIHERLADSTEEVAEDAGRNAGVARTARSVPSTPSKPGPRKPLLIALFGLSLVGATVILVSVLRSPGEPPAAVPAGAVDLLPTTERAAAPEVDTGGIETMGATVSTEELRHMPPDDAAREVKRIREQAENGVAGAQLFLGLIHFKGVVVSRDASEGVRWIRKAAKQGDADAQALLGISYATGDGVARDYRQALLWLRKAADQNSAVAQFQLGVLYANGEGVARDPSAAASWFGKAAAQDSPAAQSALGMLYLEGRGVPQDATEALRWLRKAAANGSADAQLQIGVLYADGRGVAKDEVEARTWYLRAAEQGHPGAEFRLGYSALVGSGTERDLKTGVEWLTRAAEHGHAQAQWVLAMLYAKGMGVTKDETEAVKWLKKSAAQGDENARRELRDRGLDW